MIEEYNHVRIKKTGITGIVVDISDTNGRKTLIVESDDEGVPGGWGSEGSWKLFDCTEDELELLED